jgi:hypothetical protein
MVAALSASSPLLQGAAARGACGTCVEVVCNDAVRAGSQCGRPCGGGPAGRAPATPRARRARDAARAPGMPAQRAVRGGAGDGRVRGVRADAAAPGRASLLPAPVAQPRRGCALPHGARPRAVPVITGRHSARRHRALAHALPVVHAGGPLPSAAVTRSGRVQVPCQPGGGYVVKVTAAQAAPASLIRLAVLGVRRRAPAESAWCQRRSLPQARARAGARRWRDPLPGPARGCARPAFLCAVCACCAVSAWRLPRCY